MKKPLILISNDDSIYASGIAALVEALEPFGELIIVAPDSHQSGMGHAVTVGRTLTYGSGAHVFPSHQSYHTSGTPADCIKLGMDKILDRKPDLIVSGINHGSNSSINVIYSGTMAAAIEGAVLGIPSIGFSLCDFSANADFSLAKQVVAQIVPRILETSLPTGVALNVNIPKIDIEHYKGIKISRQATALWSENFEQRTDPYGRNYYWMVGKFILNDQGTDTDEWALANGYTSVVPVHTDLTAYEALENLRKIDF